MKWIHVTLSAAVAAATLSACSPSAPDVAPAAGAAATVTESPQASTISTPPPTAASSITTSVAPPGDSRAYTTSEVQGWVKDATTAPGKLVFLTFDDGPNHDVTPRMLDVLRASGVHATFFVVGNEVPGAPDILEREVAEGHRIALHSLTHDYEKLYPGRSANADRVAWEFDETLAAVRAVLGGDFSTTAWRYPGGHESWTNLTASDAALEARGAAWLDWNAMTGDAEPKKRRPTTVDTMVAKAVDPITDGVEVVVLLAHDSRGKDLTVDSLPRVIQAYKEAGYGFGTLS